MTEPTYLLTEAQRDDLNAALQIPEHVGEDEYKKAISMLQSLPIVQGETFAWLAPTEIDEELGLMFPFTQIASDTHPDVKALLGAFPVYTSPQALTPINKSLEDLLGQYWDIAYKEGQFDEPNGNKANDVLHKIRAMFKQLTPITADDVTGEMVAMYRHSINSNSYIEHEIAAAYNAVIKNRSEAK